jgi:CHAT domain-containing protein/Tfp pilus assembly protein PilF
MVVCGWFLFASGVSSREVLGQSANNPEPETLDAGVSFERQIGGGQTKSFRVHVIASQYLRVAIKLQGIILRATLLDSTGNPVVTMSNPSGGYGTIYLSEIARDDGPFTIKVFSTEDFANAGVFQIAVDPLRVADKHDERQIAAERWFAKAVQEDDARQFAAAVDDFGKAFSAWQEIGSAHWQALTQYALAQTCRRSGNAKVEEESLNRALEFHLSEDDWRLTAAALNDLGLNQAQAGNNGRAESALKAALQLFETHGDAIHHDRRGQASARNNLAITYGRMGDLRKALEVSQPVPRLRREENFQAGANNALNTLAVISDKLGEPYEALDYSNQALAGWQELIKNKQRVEPDQLARALNSVALANERIGNLDLATQSYQDALSVPDISADLRAAILDNHGDFYTSQGDFESALVLFTKVTESFKAISRLDPDFKAGVLLHIGEVKLLQGDIDAAFSQFQQAQAANPNRPKLSYVLTALGDCRRRRGDSSAALKSYKAALEIQKEIEDRRGQAITLQKIGEVYAGSGDLEQASGEYHAALTLWRAVKDLRGEAAVLNDVAVLERQRDNLSAALEYSEEVTRILESTRTRISSHKLRSSYFAEHEKYYELNIDLKMTHARRNQSSQQLADALAASERSRARSLMDMLAEDRVNIANQRGNTLLTASDEIRRKVQAKTDAQTTLLSGKHSEAQVAEIANELSELLTQQDEIESRIRSQDPKYADWTEPSVLTATEIQRQIDPDTVLIEYSLGEERSYAWAVTPDSIKGFQLPPRAEIESAANRIVKSLADRKRIIAGESNAQYERRREQADRDFNTASAELSDKIIRPLASLLGTKRLVVVADGALQLVSFAALPIPGAAATAAKKQRRLIEDHEIVYEPSASVLALQRSELANRKPGNHAVAILANPVFATDDSRVAALMNPNAPPKVQPKSNSQAVPEVATRRGDISRALEDIGLERFPALPSSAVEAQKIRNFAPKGESKIALDFDASRETAMSKELSQYRIVHFATHAVVNYEHPELSGIVLSMVDRRGQPQDGYLRLHDIYSLNLPADLVVLSACQTGVGKEIKGEGLIALTRGFMYAGAERVVASLWKVDDVATEELMSEFYKQIFVNGRRPAAALHAAQTMLAKKWPPVDWAGFVLQGEWK